ncbi:MAG: hypothetical protein WKG07_09740 [Hymenobacter sp.]
MPMPTTGMLGYAARLSRTRQAPTFRAAAGLSSTIDDYAVFLQMLLNGGTYGGHRLLQARHRSL